MVHIWQYQKIYNGFDFHMSAVTIGFFDRCLSVIKDSAYNYDINEIVSASSSATYPFASKEAKESKYLLDYNIEQQAEIQRD
jgi:hypothetical protein